MGAAVTLLNDKGWNSVRSEARNSSSGKRPMLTGMSFRDRATGAPWPEVTTPPTRVGNRGSKSSPGKVVAGHSGC